MKNTQLFLLVALIGLAFFGCKKNPDDNSINIFSIEDDKALGLQLKQEIEANPTEYKILKQSEYPVAYGHLLRIRDSILNSGKVFYAKEFKWETYIIHDDKVLNAFCAPGGYIYVYTGLIKYLDSEEQLAGVLAHEIAHADRRHSTDQLTKAYGVSFLISVLLGNNKSMIGDVLNTLVSLKFSRDDETEADTYSVKYLCPTSYKADGAAGFFEKIEAEEGGQNIPQFLSTHPNPENRIANIKNQKTTLNCKGDGSFTTRYQEFKNSLP